MSANATNDQWSRAAMKTPIALALFILFLTAFIGSTYQSAEQRQKLGTFATDTQQQVRALEKRVEALEADDIRFDRAQARRAPDGRRQARVHIIRIAGDA